MVCSYPGVSLHQQSITTASCLLQAIPTEEAPWGTEPGISCLIKLWSLMSVNSMLSIKIIHLVFAYCAT